jgi:hypothetical protein
VAYDIASIYGDRIIDSGNNGGCALSIPKGGWLVLRRPNKKKYNEQKGQPSNFIVHLTMPALLNDDMYMIIKR